MQTVKAAGRVAERVRALREALGWTQQALADTSGLARDAVSRIETGRNQATSGHVRKKLARGFGLTLEDAYAFVDGRLSVVAAAMRAKPPKRKPVAKRPIPQAA
jgi:transcriptional regulator with XRE-family HTH domain